MIENVYKSVELSWLKTGDVNCTPDGEACEEMEYKRTKAGMDLLLAVYNGEYDKLTSCQKGSDKLTRESFNEIKGFVQETLKTEEDLKAMLVNLIINDLGKINSFVEKVAANFGVKSVDHDVILFEGLSSMPELSPSFNKLEGKYKDIILSGMKTAFNMGQFVQSESMLNNLKAFMGLDKGTKDFYLIHSLFDVAGAAGHVVSNGSPILTESYWKNFKAAKDAIYGNTIDSKAEMDYLSSRGNMLGIEANTNNNIAVIKICNMARVNNAADAKKVSAALKNQPKQVSKRVIKELARTQMPSRAGEHPAILIYYAPAMFCNYIKACGDVYMGVFEVFPIMAALYGNIRNAVKGNNNSNTVIAFAADVAEAAKQPEMLKNSIFSISHIGEDLKINITPKEQITADVTHSFNVKGNNILIIGIGGGTDSIQGAMLARHLLQGRAHTIVSIRSGRTVAYPKREVCKNVYEIGRSTTTTNRYVEDVPYNMGFKTYLIVDTEVGDETIVEGINTILGLEEYDSILCVDTGGDCMFSASIDDKSYSPDQDRKVLSALAKLERKVPMQLTIVAPDIDAPNGKISETLKNANAKLYEVPETIASDIIKSYNDNEMDGSNLRRFGKTQLIWKAALSGEAGLTTVNIPLPYVIDDKNAWIPTAVITDNTRKIAICTVSDLLNATR